MKEHIVAALCCILLISISALSANAATCTYYVSYSTGKDTNNGTSASKPWKTISYLNTKTIQPGQTVCFKSGDTWRFPSDAYLIPKSGSSAGYVTYTAYGSGSKPLFLGSETKNSTANWYLTSTPNVWSTPDNSFYRDGIYYAVGNMIFNDEESVGKMEVNGIAYLDNQGEFYYDPDRRRVLLYSISNPASYYSDIECALHRHMFLLPFSSSYIKLSDLDLRNGGSHGIQSAGDAHHLIITDNDISYIGGAVQFIDPETGEKVRYGNGIEAWDAAHDIYIERNRIWEIFDGALSIEGNTGSKSNIYVLYNIVSEAGNCLYYNSTGGTASNIHYENNTCVYSGYGWGSEPQGRPWMGMNFLTYDNLANASDFYVRNNIFYEAMSRGLQIGGWTESALSILVFDNNVWYDSSDIPTIPYNPPWSYMIWYCRSYADPLTCNGYSMATFSQYQVDTGKDINSVAADPLFNNVLNDDFSPVIGSPACTSGSYVGALPCVNASDSDSDEMPDYWEIRYDLDPYNLADAGYDDDSDGLTNLEEFEMGTDPTDLDTDDDSIFDGSDNCPTIKPVNITGTSSYFNNIQLAYDSAVNLDVILSQYEFLTGGLTFDKVMSITLRGGYDCRYQANTGETVIKGDVQINNGSINIDSGRFTIE